MAKSLENSQDIRAVLAQWQSSGFVTFRVHFSAARLELEPIHEMTGRQARPRHPKTPSPSFDGEWCEESRRSRFAKTALEHAIETEAQRRNTVVYAINSLECDGQVHVSTRLIELRRDAVFAPPDMVN